MVASPVGTGHLHQLENLEFGRGRHVRTTTKVDELALAIEGNLLTSRNGADQLSLVVLALSQEKFDGLVPIPDFADNRNVALGQLPHALLDGYEVFGRKWALVSEVIIETVFDHRPDSHLRLREEVFHGKGQQVGGGVANDFQPLGIAISDDGQIAIPLDQAGGIDQLAADLAGQGRTGQTGTNAGRHIGHGDRLLKRPLRTIRQSNDRHETLQKAKKSELEAGRPGSCSDF